MAARGLGAGAASEERLGAYSRAIDQTKMMSDRFR